MLILGRFFRLFFQRIGQGCFHLWGPFGSDQNRKRSRRYWVSFLLLDLRRWLFSIKLSHMALPKAPFNLFKNILRYLKTCTVRFWFQSAGIKHFPLRLNKHMTWGYFQTNLRGSQDFNHVTLYGRPNFLQLNTVSLLINYIWSIHLSLLFRDSSEAQSHFQFQLKYTQSLKIPLDTAFKRYSSKLWHLWFLFASVCNILWSKNCNNDKEIFWLRSFWTFIWMKRIGIMHNKIKKTVSYNI